MNSHQRRITRRRLLRAGQPLPLWLWPHTITRAGLDEIRPRGKRISPGDVGDSYDAVRIFDVCLSISQRVIG